jgi:hypothetical protein
VFTEVLVQDIHTSELVLRLFPSVAEREVIHLIEHDIE